MQSPTKTPRFWQTRVKFKDGAEGTLTIQSEEGRSRGREDAFVLETIGAIRANTGWSFHFIGRAVELPTFVTEQKAVLLDNQTPYWLDSAKEPAALNQ